MQRRSPLLVNATGKQLQDARAGSLTAAHMAQRAVSIGMLTHTF